MISELGIDTSKVKLMFKTNLMYQKLDNGDWEFTFPDGVTMTYLTMYVATKDTVVDMETDSLLANFYVFRQ
jgi:hypothetical protein